MKKTDGDC